MCGFSFSIRAPWLNCRRMSLCASLEGTLKVLHQNASLPEVREILKLAPTTSYSLCGPHHPFIVIEGLDATGKTTVAKCLANQLNGTFLATPSSEFKPYRSFFDSQHEALRRAYYSLGNYSIAENIGKLLQDKPVILDRYWHSTAAYSLAKQDVLPAEGSDVYLWPKDLQPCPQIIFFLHTDEAVRLQRHKARATTNTDEEQRITTDEMYRKKLCEVYGRFFNPTVTAVDASNTVSAVVENIFQKLGENVCNSKN